MKTFVITMNKELPKDALHPERKKQNVAFLEKTQTYPWIVKNKHLRLCIQRFNDE